MKNPTDWPRLFIEKGVGPDTIVGIMMERSIEMIIGILGILKAGGAYLPIDPEYPQERIDYMLKDSAAKLLVITNNKESEKVGKWEGEKVHLEEISNFPKSSSYPFTHLPSYFQSSLNLAYIIYTSGSTGRPKGVMISHRNVVNYNCWAIKQYAREQKVSFPFFTSLSFDLTVTSIFTPLLSGNRVIIYEWEIAEILIGKIIEENRVEVLKLTPSHLKLILLDPGIDHFILWDGEKKSHIKQIIVGGELLETGLARGIVEKFNSEVAIYNEYGPTEATVGCMIYEFSPQKNFRESVPIGTPCANTRIYLLDKNKKPVPIGVPGEIYISGDGVARGYLNRPELTAEKFIIPASLPFNTRHSIIPVTWAGGCRTPRRRELI